MVRLSALSLCLLLAGAQDPADPVKTLIEKLASDELAVREAAHLELTRLGRRAMPALYEAVAGATGEQQARLQRILEHITAFGTPPLITLSVTDRPLREVAPELARQSGVPIRLVGAAGDAKVAIMAKQAILWKVVEDVCRARGDLMYRVVESTLEIHPRRFRALPTADAHGIRFVIDRFIWDGNHFYQHGALLTAPGARVVRIWPKIEEFVDDLGYDPHKGPRHRSEFVQWGESCFPNSNQALHPFTFHRWNARPSALEATKIVRCRGTIEVWLAGREHVLGSIRDPLAKPSHPEGEQTPSLGISRWRVEDGHLVVQFSSRWDESSFRFTNGWLGPRTILRYKNGDWRSPVGLIQEESTPSPGETKRSGRIVRFPWPDGSVADSFEFIAPDALVKIEIPFDFRDLPLR